ncbi:hypothetical protein EWM64_g4932 [Hericium alpestre]|uniref:Uncharacterized protein n=1 Tax=Hericium alpestre TaxID=135208 RepID=A0A4Y9ZY14_9AGAM|nr:hypothetical protein EWM64_g4932 [Hericium alpestre]
MEDDLDGGPVYYEDVAPTHVLQLPDSLKELKLDDEVAAVDRMLEYVMVPLTTTLRLEVTLQGYWERTREERIAKLVALCSKIPGARHIPLATLEFSSISRMVGWERYKPHSLDRDDLGHRRFDVSFDVDDEDKGPHSQYTRAVASGLDFRGTACLILDHCDHIGEADFFCIFAGMKDLREVSITSCQLKQVLGMVGIQSWKDRLRKEPNFVPAIAGPGALWPVLETMTIKTSYSLLMQCWPTLLRALEHRSKWRIDIKSLAIVVDSFPRDHIERCKADLKRFVRKVSIDVPHDWKWDPKHHH